MISRIGMIVWFGLYGLNYFLPIPAIGLILAVVAIVVAIALIANN
jgi:hypothetical protein